jgi:hypothetical protein
VILEMGGLGRIFFFFVDKGLGRICACFLPFFVMISAVFVFGRWVIRGLWLFV